MTWNEIVSQALFDSGVNYLGQTPTPENQSAGFIRLNLLLSSFSRDGLIPPALTTITLVLTPNKYVYTAGPQGELSARPLEMDSVFVTGAVLGDLKRPIRIANWIEWNQIALPTVPSVPYLISMNPDFPLAGIYLYPTPNYNFTLSIFGKFAYSSVTTAHRNDESTLPEGFEESFLDVLAARIDSSYRALDPTDSSKLQAKASNSYKKLLVSLPYWNGVQPNPRTLMLSGKIGTINWNIGVPNRGLN